MLGRAQRGGIHDVELKSIPGELHQPVGVQRHLGRELDHVAQVHLERRLDPVAQVPFAVAGELGVHGHHQSFEAGLLGSLHQLGRTRPPAQEVELKPGGPGGRGATSSMVCPDMELRVKMVPA